MAELPRLISASDMKEALFLSGARLDSYDPFHDEWTQGESYPDSLSDEIPTWTGMEMIVWDSKNSTGYLYYP